MIFSFSEARWEKHLAKHPPQSAMRPEVYARVWRILCARPVRDGLTKAQQTGFLYGASLRKLHLLAKAYKATGGL